MFSWWNKNIQLGETNMVENPTLSDIIGASSTAIDGTAIDSTYANSCAIDLTFTSDDDVKSTLSLTDTDTLSTGVISVITLDGHPLAVVRDEDSIATIIEIFRNKLTEHYKKSNTENIVLKNGKAIFIYKPSGGLLHTLAVKPVQYIY